MPLGSRIGSVGGGISEQTADANYLNKSANLSDVDDVATSRTNLGLVSGGSGDIWVKKSGDTMTGKLTLVNTGLQLLDTNASHYLVIAPGSDLSANRTLTLTTGDASRTVTLNGNLTVGVGGATVTGTNTGDLTLGTNTATALSLVGQELSLADVFVQLAGDTMTGALVGVQIDVDNLRLDGNTLSSLSGGITIKPLAGQSLNLSLSTTGDFTINSTDFVWDTSAKKLGIGGAPTYTIDVFGQGGALDGVMRFTNTTANSTNKTGGIIVGHYTNGEEPINLAVVTSQSTQTIFTLGGGNGSFNTITESRIYTAANNTTLSGTLAQVIDSSQNVGYGVSIPLAKMHIKQPTDGSEVLRVETTCTNTTASRRCFQADAFTTNATVTTGQTLATSTAFNYQIETDVVARQTGGAAGTVGDLGSYSFVSSFRNVAGTVTQVGTTTSLVSHEDQAAWNAVHTISGTNILVDVTGEANKNILWVITSEIDIV